MVGISLVKADHALLQFSSLQISLMNYYEALRTWHAEILGLNFVLHKANYKLCFVITQLLACYMLHDQMANQYTISISFYFSYTTNNVLGSVCNHQFESKDKTMKNNKSKLACFEEYCSGIKLVKSFNARISFTPRHKLP